MSELNVVVGLGVTGFSCVRYLCENKFRVAVTDTRLNPPLLNQCLSLYPEVPLSLGRIDENLLLKASRIILSPGLSLQLPEIAKQVKRGVPVIGDIELFAQYVKKPVIAITGTNAKSTVTTLVGLMAQAAGYHAQAGGNLGVPVLDLWVQYPETDLFVLELSSFQLETLSSLKPAVASILNITPDHMDRYPSLADYQKTKQKIYSGSERIVYNRDDSLTYCKEASIKSSCAFTLNTPKQNEFGLTTHKDQLFLSCGETPLISVQSLPVFGRHYQANALAALAIGYSMGFPMEPMLAVLKTFKGLPHRCQRVREWQGVTWYNDSKGTNVGASVAAVEGLGKDLEGKVILIAGGRGKGTDFAALLKTVKQYVRHVILIGESAPILASLFKNHVSFSFASSMNDAVHQASLAAKAKDCVLLSPACASFDMFENYEHRGQVFMEEVMKL